MTTILWALLIGLLLVGGFVTGLIIGALVTDAAKKPPVPVEDAPNLRIIHDRDVL